MLLARNSIKRVLPALFFSLLLIPPAASGARKKLYYEEVAAGERVYYRVHVKKAKPEGLLITHSKGIALIKPGNLPAELQIEFGYEVTAGEEDDAYAKAGTFFPEMEAGGRVFQDVYVRKVNSGGLVIEHKEGLASVKAGELSPSLQEAFGYKKPSRQVQSAASSEPPPEYSYFEVLQAGDQTYYEVKIKQVKPEALVIEHRDGEAVIPADQLSVDMQDRFGYIITLEIEEEEMPAEEGDVIPELKAGGRTYRQVKLVEKRPFWLVIEHAAGIAHIPPIQLSPDWQAYFGYKVRRGHLDELHVWDKTYHDVHIREIRDQFIIIKHSKGMAQIAIRDLDPDELDLSASFWEEDTDGGEQDAMAAEIGAEEIIIQEEAATPPGAKAPAPRKPAGARHPPSAKTETERRKEEERRKKAEAFAAKMRAIKARREAAERASRQNEETAD